MSTLVSTPAERISQAIQESGHTPTEICKVTGICKPSLSCWMSGKYSPKGDALYKLGRALNVSEMWLAGYDVPKARLADQADALADAIARARQDPDFRILLEIAGRLSSEQLRALTLVASQFPPAGPGSSGEAPDRCTGPEAR